MSPRKSFALEFGQRVRKARTQMQMTQSRLGQLAELGTNYIPRVERGELVPSIETAWRISRALGKSIDEEPAAAATPATRSRRACARSRRCPTPISTVFAA